jgi:hypothetical protein
LSSDNKETFVVIEDPSLNDFDLDVMSLEVVKCTKRDSSHLELYCGRKRER